MRYINIDSTVLILWVRRHAPIVKICFHLVCQPDGRLPCFHLELPMGTSTCRMDSNECLAFQC